MLYLRHIILSAADNDKMDVVCIPGRIANVESARALREGCYRPDVVGKWREFIRHERMLLRPFVSFLGSP